MEEVLIREEAPDEELLSPNDDALAEDEPHDEPEEQAPWGQQLLEVLESMQQEAERAKEEAEEIRSEAVFARDLAEIQRVNPNIQSLHDLGEQFYRLRAAGIGNLEAFEIVSKPKTRQGASGKEHLITTGGGASSGGLMDIPRSELGFWRDSFPEDSSTKLKERYHRAMKRQGN